MDPHRLFERPFRVAPYFSPRLWGTRDLRAWYPEHGTESEPIGEAWLTADRCHLWQHPDLTLAQWPGGFPLLTKFLFPHDKLSVQVHPNDAQAAAAGIGRGKTEMWYVVAADPGAQLGVDLAPGTTLEQLEKACEAGAGAELLNWFPVQAGDTVFVPAGTIHAIGAGMVLCEVQQQSDNTYRLDDFGRRDSQGRLRELHLKQGLAVARPQAGGGLQKTGLSSGESGLLVACAYFRVERRVWHGAYRPSAGRLRLLIPLQGEVRLQPAEGEPLMVPLAHAVVIPPTAGPVELQGTGVALEVTVPDPCDRRGA